MLNVKVHGNAIRKRLNMCSLFGNAIRKKAASLGLQNCIGTNPKTSGTMPFGQTRQKWKCLSAIAPFLAKTEHSMWAQTPHTNCQAGWWMGDDLGLLCSHKTWAPHSH